MGWFLWGPQEHAGLSCEEKRYVDTEGHVASDGKRLVVSDKGPGLSWHLRGRGERPRRGQVALNNRDRGRKSIPEIRTGSEEGKVQSVF